MKQDVLKILRGLVVNLLIIVIYILIFPPHRKFGYFFAEITFGSVHIILGLAVTLFRVSARSLFFLFTMSGNLLFTLYFLGFMVDFPEVQASILLVIPLLSLALSVGLTYYAYRKIFRARRESL